MFVCLCGAVGVCGECHRVGHVVIKFPPEGILDQINGKKKKSGCAYAKEKGIRNFKSPGLAGHPVIVAVRCGSTSTTATAGTSTRSLILFRRRAAASAAVVDSCSKGPNGTTVVCSEGKKPRHQEPINLAVNVTWGVRSYTHPLQIHE